MVEGRGCCIGKQRGRTSIALDGAPWLNYHSAMPRRPRQAPGGILRHLLNRAVARLPLFEKPTDYEAFRRVLAETLDRFPTRLLSVVLMPWSAATALAMSGRVDSNRRPPDSVSSGRYISP